MATAELLGAMLAGAGIALVIFWAGYYTITFFRRIATNFRAALHSITGLSMSVQAMLPLMQQMRDEMQMLRGMITPQQAYEPMEEGAAAQEQRRPRAPFPAPNYAIYKRDVPDATVEDTEIYETDDAALAEEERVESVRGRGWEPELNEVEPGKEKQNSDYVVPSLQSKQ